MSTPTANPPSSPSSPHSPSALSTTSSPSSPSNTRKRTRDDKPKTTPPPVASSTEPPQPATATATPTPTPQNPAPATATGSSGTTRNARYSSEDLLGPVAGFDWDEFQSQCRDGIAGMNEEEEALVREYMQWQWLHEIWTQARSASDTVRLNQEVCTISRWTELKEAEVEEARSQHLHSLQQISKVLGISSPS
ncbi:hypothetical protein EX30DRAFT_340318 [Ascodesmis nigricans]|uniref:Uncharacterized protein n=1 Tax=Ascodesmis nigricans TaxID=341454 RepID=A0A4S2MZ54_9PEZI|nr:hypothetical protein EX30DRAFT_340318 [Ascodesmis nigricans]